MTQIYVVTQSRVNPYAPCFFNLKHNIRPIILLSYLDSISLPSILSQCSTARHCPENCAIRSTISARYNDKALTKCFSRCPYKAHKLETFHISSNVSSSKKPFLNLSFADHIIYSKAWPIFYSKNTFVFGRPARESVSVSICSKVDCNRP